jgi:hypothetical protein
MENFDSTSTLGSRIKLFADWLNNGGVRTIWSQKLLEDLIAVEFDAEGNAIESTVSSVVRSAMLAYEGTQRTPPSYSTEYMTEYETLLQKSLFFEQINIETKEDFDQIFEEHKNSKNMLFRGVAEAKWRIYSALQRFWINEHLEEKSDYKSFLKTMIENAKKQNGNLLSKYFTKNGISPNNDMAILSYLQHYGCPTPLVDWTTSFINSLFFATEKVINKTGEVREIEKYFSVYFIEEKNLIEIGLTGLVEKGMEDILPRVKKNIIVNAKKEGMSENEINKFFGRDRLKASVKMLHQKSLIEYLASVERLISFPLTYFSDWNEDTDIQFSLNNNLNIVNQAGVFVWNSHPCKPIEHIGNELYGNEENLIYRFSKCYNINKKLEVYVKGKVQAEGVDKNYIYPNPETIARKAFEETKAGY